MDDKSKIPDKKTKNPKNTLTKEDISAVAKEIRRLDKEEKGILAEKQRKKQIECMRLVLSRKAFELEDNDHLLRYLANENIEKYFELHSDLLSLTSILNKINDKWSGTLSKLTDKELEIADNYMYDFDDYNDSFTTDKFLDPDEFRISLVKHK